MLIAVFIGAVVCIKFVNYYLHRRAELDGLQSAIERHNSLVPEGDRLSQITRGVIEDLFI